MSNNSIEALIQGLHNSTSTSNSSINPIATPTISFLMADLPKNNRSNGGRNEGVSDGHRKHDDDVESQHSFNLFYKAR